MFENKNTRLSGFHYLCWDKKVCPCRTLGPFPFFQKPQMCTACCSLPDHSCLIYFGLFYSCFQPHGGSDGKKSTCNARDQVPPLVREDPLEKGMATHSSLLAWRIPWTEEPSGLQSPWLQRVGQSD